MSDRIVGIDLGTSNTVVAIVDEMDKVRSLADSDGNTVQPSVVSFHPSGGVVVGAGGKQRKVLDPRNTIYSAKRMIGQPFDSFAVRETARRVPFEIKEGPNHQAIVATRTGEFAIPEISAIVLDHVRKIATKSLGSDVSRAVITVPASFTDVQRASTANAGALAGLTVVRVLNEPTAAALAYGASKRLNEIIAVYDFGGGTFDITILQLQDQVYTVLGTSGDAFLGGEDIDERLVDRMVKTFHEKHSIDLRNDDVSMMRLRAVAEHTKIELSKRSRAIVQVEEVAYAVNGAPIDLVAEISRDELVSSITDLVERTFVSCKEAMALANITSDRIADVILVGGTTRIPFVRDQVSRFFGKAPRLDVNPDDAIATGAALQASSIEQMLARSPQKPGASIQIPVEDLMAEALAPARKPPPGSTPKASRKKDDTATVAARGKAFFGDLFGDKPAAPAKPEPARTRPARESLDWAPPAGTAFSDDPDAVDVFSPEPGHAATAQIADLSDDVEPVDDEIALEVAEPSIPAIKLTESDLVPIDAKPRRAARTLDDFDLANMPPPAADELAIDVDVSPPELHPRSGAIELDWAPPPGAGLKRQPTVPSVVLELDVVPPVRADDFSADLDLPLPKPLNTDKAYVLPTHASPAMAAHSVPAAVIDVTPRGLGIGTVAGFCEELIRRNSQLPASIARSFVTSRDAQETVRIVICQGESRRIENNVVIGDLVLSNLPRRARGETRIDVEFVIDLSGILHVSARDAATGAEQRAELDLEGGMDPEDLASAAKRLQHLSSVPLDS